MDVTVSPMATVLYFGVSESESIESAFNAVGFLTVRDLSLRRHEHDHEQPWPLPSSEQQLWTAAHSQALGVLSYRKPRVHASKGAHAEGEAYLLHSRSSDSRPQSFLCLTSFHLTTNLPLAKLLDQ